MTGATSYHWDTKKIGDGIYNITLTAYDKAGNKAQTLPVSVDIINSKIDLEAQRARLEAVKNLYLAIGTPLGFVLGVLIACVILKKKE